MEVTVLLPVYYYSITTPLLLKSLANSPTILSPAGGDPLGQFAVIQWGEGGWALIVKEPLDRERTDSYTLTLLASDGKFEAQVAVKVLVLDINDNPPLCQQVRSI